MGTTLVHVPQCGRWTWRRVIMDRMPLDQQPVGPPESVVELGTTPDEPRPARRRWSLAAFAAGLADDRRAVPLAAVVGGVALFASVISEWQITEFDVSRFGGIDGG